MTTRTLSTALFLLAVGLLSLNGALARPQDPPPDDDQANRAPPGQEGVEFLARGPVHEAFAEPAIRGPRPSPLISKKPPAIIEELPPDQKPEGTNVQWIPGYWAWDDDRRDFLWVSGTWRDVPPGKTWVPGNWGQVEGGWQWVAGYWASPEQTDVEFLPQPPNPVAEAVTEQPSANTSYVPGCWVYHQTRYQWRPGFWNPLRPGWIWNPAHYVWTPGGFIFVDGFWDYPLQNRGLLFAPVYFQQPVWTQPDWVYRPTYVIRDQFLLGALFVRPSTCHYYFGDFFEQRYERLGFTSWVDFRVSRHFPDPMFAYYRWNFRDNPNWGGELRDLYIARREGVIAPPPRTIVYQNNLIQNNQTTIVNNIQNLNINKAVNITNIQNMAPGVSLTQVNQTMLRMQPVREAQAREVRQVARQFHDASRQRAVMQAQVRTQGLTRPGQTEAPRPIRVETQHVRMPTTNLVGAKAPPPVPTMPKFQQRPTVQDNPGSVPTRPGTVRIPEERTLPGAPRPTEDRTRPVTPRPTEDRKPGTPRPTEDRKPGTPRPTEERPRPGADPKPIPRPTPNRPTEEKPKPGPGRTSEPTPRPGGAAEPLPVPRPATNRPAEERRPTPTPDPRPAPSRTPETQRLPTPAPQPRPAPEPRPAPSRTPETQRPPAPAPQPRPAPEPRPAPSRTPETQRPPAPAPQPRPVPEPRPTPRPNPPKPPEATPRPAAPAPHSGKPSEAHPRAPAAPEPRPGH